MSGKKCKYFLTISIHSTIIRTEGISGWFGVPSIKVVELDDSVGNFIWSCSQVYSYERDHVRIVYSI